MKQDGGWIELVEPDSHRVRARAHLMFDCFPIQGGWGGELESVRVRPAEIGLLSGTYLACFSGDVHPVRVEISGPHALVHCEAGLPTILAELSEGE